MEIAIPLYGLFCFLVGVWLAHTLSFATKEFERRVADRVLGQLGTVPPETPVHDRRELKK